MAYLDEMSDLDKAIDVARGVKRLQQQIRQKHNEYVGNIILAEQEIEKSLKPITVPLRTLTSSNRLWIKQEDPIDIKEEYDRYSTASPARSANTSDRESLPPTRQERDGESDGERSMLDTSTSVTSVVYEIGNLLDSTAESYFHKVLTDTDKEIDTTYGVSFDPESNSWMLGNERVLLDRKSILLGGRRYEYSPGFFELLFMRKPNMGVIKKRDLSEYKDILNKSSVHLNKLGNVKSSTSQKYKSIISKLFPPKRTGSSAGSDPRCESASETPSTSTRDPRSITGSGVLMKHETNKIDYRHWDDANELVDRLRLLIASKRAGHSGHNNEIIAIVEELKEAKLIAGRMLKV